MLEKLTPLDAIGKRFGYLTVHGVQPSDRHRRACILVECDCGRSLTKVLKNLRKGTTRTCGFCELRYQLPPVSGSTSIPPDIKQKLLKILFSEFKSESKRRNRIFHLTFEDFSLLIDVPCISCGDAPASFRTYTYAGQQYTINYNGIDRIDNTLDYRTGNVQTMCKPCNWMKRDLTPEQMIKHGNGLIRMGERLKNMNQYGPPVSVSSTNDPNVLFTNKTSCYDLDNLPKVDRLSYVSFNDLDTLIGKKFNHLTITGVSKIKSDKPVLFATCDCGNKSSVHFERIIGGFSRTCGKCDLRYSLPPNIAKTQLKYYIKIKIIKKLYSMQKSYAKRRSKDFKLSIQEFNILILMNCQSCTDFGSNYSTYKVKREYYTLFYNGLDRINSKFGYRMDNVQTLCKNCNRMKNDQTIVDCVRRARGIARLGEQLLAEVDSDLRV